MIYYSLLAFLLIGFWPHYSKTYATSTLDSKVNVRFYGEAQCPFCRRFVTEVWPNVWNDPELRELIDYDFIPWGNAYFPNAACGGTDDDASYDPNVRQCWYKRCIDTKDTKNPNKIDTKNDEDCFSGEPIYQHSQKEGQIDIYESCVKEILGLDAAVAFTYCCEGPNMDDENLSSAKDLMEKCIAGDDDTATSSSRSGSSNVADLVSTIQECFDTSGRLIEINNAKQTPAHAGVPYVVVDGIPLDNPFSVKDAICERLDAKQNMGRTGNLNKKPSACREGKEIDITPSSSSSSFLRGI